VIDRKSRPAKSTLTLAVLGTDGDRIVEMLPTDMCNRLVRNASFEVGILYSGVSASYKYFMLATNFRSADLIVLDSLQQSLPLTASFEIPEMELVAGYSIPSAAILQPNFGDMQSIECDLRAETLFPTEEASDTVNNRGAKMKNLSVEDSANGMKFGVGVKINDRLLAVRLLATLQKACLKKNVQVYRHQKDSLSVESTLMLKNMRTAWSRKDHSVTAKPDSDTAASWHSLDQSRPRMCGFKYNNEKRNKSLR
jgi:hypothetical protein